MAEERCNELREIALVVADDLICSGPDDGLIRDAAHDLGHDFPVHVEEYRTVRRLIRDAHVVLPGEEE